MYLTIDFEDFNHDLKRSLGIWETGPLKSDFLWKKYYLINDIFRKSNKNKGSYGTFFCTGIIAEKEPDLIKQIANDGHEIGCHYYFHDVMLNQSSSHIEKNILIAKNNLEEASGKKVNGFRAPYFAIDKNSPKQYKIIEKYFDYDSSYSCTTKSELELFRIKMGLTKLKLLPIFQQKIANINFKLGGSYLKIFPKFYMDMMMRKSIEKGFVPHIYLHPYEFGTSEELRVCKYDLQALGFMKSVYWRMRQNQWINFKNQGLIKKIEFLNRTNNLDGILSEA